MTRVLSTAERADEVVERDRVAWNLPRSTARATAHIPPRPRARYGLAAVPSAGEVARPEPVSPESTATETWEDEGGATR